MYFLLFHFFVYGILGWCVEVAFAGVKERRFVNRGFLNGPICPIYGIGVSVVVLFLSKYEQNLLVLYVTSVLLVTVLEWVTGFLLEKVFHNKWWDYSNMRFNLNGYVCLYFSLIWGAACVVIVKFIHPVIHTGILWIPKLVGVVLLVILSAAMAADLYVTVAAILKMNRRLKAMSEIAEELHRISEELGENIYKEVNEALEKGEEFQESVREKREELKQRYQEIKDSRSSVGHRLLKAFPSLQSGRYKEAMEDLRSHLKRT